MGKMDENFSESLKRTIDNIKNMLYISQSNCNLIGLALPVRQIFIKLRYHK